MCAATTRCAIVCVLARARASLTRRVQDDGAPFDLENYDVPLREWVATERPRKEIKRRFISPPPHAARPRHCLAMLHHAALVP